MLFSYLPVGLYKCETLHQCVMLLLVSADSLFYLVAVIVVVVRLP